MSDIHEISALEFSKNFYKSHQILQHLNTLMLRNYKIKMKQIGTCKVTVFELLYFTKMDFIGRKNSLISTMWWTQKFPFIPFRENSSWKAIFSISLIHISLQFLSCEIPFTTYSRNFSDFNWNHTKIYMFSIKITNKQENLPFMNVMFHANGKMWYHVHSGFM